MRSLLLSSVAAMFVLAACSSNSSGGTSSKGASQTATPPPECSWPADLNTPADAGPWPWSVGRYFLTCNDGNDTEGCVSDAPDSCPGPNPIPDATVSNCRNHCDSDEYVVAAGGPPQNDEDGGMTFPPAPNLPATCRFLAANPGGVEYSCCPCQ